MALVNVMVNARAYTIACDEGEEDHLKSLAAYVDEKVRELLGSVGQVGDQRLLLMAALLIADENHDLAERLDAQTRQAGELARLEAKANERVDKCEAAAADALETAAKKLEDVAARLAHA
jgi:cell division protein ZapA